MRRAFVLLALVAACTSDVSDAPPAPPALGGAGAGGSAGKGGAISVAGRGGIGGNTNPGGRGGAGEISGGGGSAGTTSPSGGAGGVLIAGSGGAVASAGAAGATGGSGGSVAGSGGSSPGGAGGAPSAGAAGAAAQGGTGGAASPALACLTAQLAKGPPGAVTPVGTTNQFTLNGQTAWYHDDGFSSGYFHTYDALDVDPGNTNPHQVHVFLPRGYEGDKSLKYPVIYMNDGNTSFFPGGIGNKSWLTQNALTALYACDAIPQTIVVAIVPVDREREYTHVAWEDGHDCCGLPAYTTYLADKVKPWIDATYRTLPDRESTTIVGSSHGGLASFWIAATRPDRFSRAIAMSSSFWVGLDFGLGDIGGPLATSALLDATKTNLGAATTRPKLWIDWGLVRTGGDQNTTIEALATSRGREMRDLLQASYGYDLGTTLAFEEDPMGEHDEISWGRRLPYALLQTLAP